MHKLTLLFLVLLSNFILAQEVEITGQCINSKKEGISDILIRINQRNEAIYTYQNGNYYTKANF
ncbi:MAG: hypothetical protein R2779_08440 [Crocinitomicaceae bacterium]